MGDNVRFVFHCSGHIMVYGLYCASRVCHAIFFAWAACDGLHGVQYVSVTMQQLHIVLLRNSTMSRGTP